MIRWLLSALLCFGQAHPAGDNRLTVGVTFSQVQCEYVGLDWKKTYRSIMDMGFGMVRLGAYWSRIEREPGVYYFDELDWQLRLAKKKNIPVLLTVGMKAPRWPEYFLPGWLFTSSRPRNGINISHYQPVAAQALKFVAALVKHYQDEPIIVAWQIENEPFNRAGPNEWWISRDFLEEEIRIVRSLDEHKRPTVVNAMSYPQTLLRIINRLAYTKNPIYECIDIADIPAVNIYSAIGHKLFANNVCFFSSARERMDYLNDIVRRASDKGKRLWVTELQAEPWEPGQLVHVGQQEAVSCSPLDYQYTFYAVKGAGVSTIFLWGAEYWMYRKLKYGDRSWLESAQELLKTVNRDATEGKDK